MKKCLISIVLFIIPCFGQSRFDKNAAKGLSSINANDLRAHLSFLASDELEGRETTFRGQKIAAQYIAAVYRKLGLKPVGQNATYFQPFELDIYRPGPTSSMNVSTSRGTYEYEFGKDFVTTATMDTTISAPAILAGFADTHRSPEQETALTDRIVVLFAGRRAEAIDTAAPRVRRMTRGPRNVAALILISDESVHGTIEEQTRSLANLLEKGSMALKGSGRRGRGPVVVLVSSAVGASLLRELGEPLPALRKRAALDSAFAAVSLNATVSLDLDVLHEIKVSENVVGLLEGSDPKLRSEAVVLTAHYDHVGVHAATGEIYNGADDDGSGTSTILELAEAFTLNPVKPKRSILFMTVAGEEKGLLGSFYYTSNPLVPLEKTIANINMDMIGRIDPKHRESGSKPYVYVIGSDKISGQLDSLLQAANKQTVGLVLDYEYNDDNDPNQFYRRSDHYNFARNGIPITFFFTGVHEDYHQPTDTIEKIEFERMVLIGQLAYATTWNVANFPRMLIKDGAPSVYTIDR